ncbi:MAG: J domain-containing protein [Leptolyngbya sp. RL_3_1]|nr:J domain-containing protein [Leptolyngbya sp. RL_3_1]
MADPQNPSTNHYQLLGIQPTASPQQIRRAYRDLSKRYHPDTTELPDAVATERFQALNEAYATLSAPDKRLAYDYRIGYARVAVMQAPAYLNRPATERSRYESSSAYLDPTDRPLSAGELFALFILGITFVCCLMLVFAISFTQGEAVQASLPWAQEAPQDLTPAETTLEETPIMPTPPINAVDPGIATAPAPNPAVSTPPLSQAEPFPTEPFQVPRIPTPMLAPP